jgi:hypothetical protein
VSALDDLTPVQVDAVIATAIEHLRDPDELAAELAPLLDDPDPSTTPVAVTEDGFDVLPRTTEIPLSAVKALLTPATVEILAPHKETSP